MQIATPERVKNILRILFTLTCVVGYVSSSNTSMFLGCGAEDEDEPETRSGEAPKFWPNPSKIPYVLDSNLREIDRTAFQNAIDQIHSVTCLRFRPRYSNEQAYIHVKVDFSNKDYCGISKICRTGSKQELLVSHKCARMTTYVHELGHAICLHHEFVRVDRNEYLSFRNCDNPPKIKNSVTTKGHMFDYRSQMSYDCFGCAGVPTMQGALSCRSRDGFSVIDADKVNAFYNCKGCVFHRWYRVDTLTSYERGQLIDFRSQKGDTKPVYLCRGYVEGNILVGTYLQAEKACWIPYKTLMHKVKKHIQLFGLPSAQNSITNTTSRYGLLDPQSNINVLKYAIRVGRRWNNEEYYAAFTAVEGPKKKMITVIGHAQPPFRVVDFWDPIKGNGNQNVQQINDRFHILGCGFNSRAADLEDTSTNNVYVKSIPE